MAQFRRWRRRGALAAIASVVMLVAPATSASAHFLGGSFPHTPGSFLNLGYTAQGSYIAQAQAAAASWHSTPTLLWVFQESIATSEEDFYGFAYSGTWWGMATLHPCSGSGCSYVWADLQLNTNTLGVESNFIRQKVACHEFGHGIGLAHVVGGTVASIMRQGTLAYNTPQPHDISDVNSLYP